MGLGACSTGATFLTFLPPRGRVVPAWSGRPVLSPGLPCRACHAKPTCRASCAEGAPKVHLEE